MNSAALRCGSRHEALRHCTIPDVEANHLGMKPNEEVTDRLCPLIALQREIEAAQLEIPLNTLDHRVVPGYFDAYRSNLIAPDHLLTGLARDAIDLCFICVPPHTRIRMDIALCSALAGNGLIRERTLYNVNKGRLHSTSLSSVYCVLLVAPPVFRNFMRKENSRASEALCLLESLQRMVTISLWNPSVGCDGQLAYDSMRMENGHPYVSTLQEMPKQYVTDADSFTRRHPEKGSILDKPNLNRLLELYFHTLPAFGHICHIMELVFETAHQPLKRCVQRSNHRAAEVSAVEHCLGNDWQSRPALLQNLLDSRKR